MKKLFFTLIVVVMMRSLAFSEASLTIHNTGTSCSYNVSWSLHATKSGYPDLICDGSAIIAPGSSASADSRCFTAFWFEGYTVNWSSLSITAKSGSCSNSYSFGNVSDGPETGNCIVCSGNYAYVTFWQKNSDGDYNIEADIITGRIMANNSNSGNNVSKINTSQVAEHMGASSLILKRAVVGSAEEVLKESNNIVLSLENTPNPVTNSSNINYELNKESNVSITLYDINGNKVLTLQQGVQKEGKYTIPLDVSPLANGMYYYSFNAGESLLTRKFMIIR